MDISSVLRLMNLFSQPQAMASAGDSNSMVMNPTPFSPNSLPQSTMSGPPPDVIPPYDPYARMKELYQPRTDISRRYSAALGSMPQIQPVSGMRQIGSMLAAGLLGTRDPRLGIGVGTEMINKPNTTRMENWQAQTEALGKGAQEEDRYNTNQRLLAEQTVSREQNQARIEETERKNRSQEDIANQKVAIAQKRADAYVFKQTHPDWKAAPTKGGNLILFNPAKPEERIDTGVPLGTLDEYDKLHFQLENKLTEIKAQGEKEKESIAARGTTSLRNIAAQGAESRKTKETPGAARPGTTVNAAGETETNVEVKDAKGNVVGTRKTVVTKDQTKILRNRAAEWLKSKNQRVTDANIQAVIDKGLVK